MQAVILAAGESSRFWPLNKKHKSLIKIAGKPLILYTIEALRRIGVKDIIVVQGAKRDVEKTLKRYKVGVIKYVVQPKAKGTGNALWQAKKYIKEPLIVTGPHKVELEDYLPSLIKRSEKTNKIVLPGFKISGNPQPYGIFQFDNKKLVKIIEKPLRKKPSNIRSVETYIFPKTFFDYYERVPKKEYNLIDAINLIIKEKGGEVFLIKKETISLKYPWKLFYILKIILERNKKYISKSAEISKGVVLNGSVYIGDNTRIGENTVIKGPCYIGSDCEIGACNVLRGPVNLENNVKIGSHCEIKNTTIGEGTHLHSGYFGDSIIGENCRFGAGFITANRRLDRKNIDCLVKGKIIDTGMTYFGAVVGDNTKFGIHCGTMPGKLIGSNCIIGPHSMVSENIEDNTKYFTEFKGVKKSS